MEETKEEEEDEERKKERKKEELEHILGFISLDVRTNPSIADEAIELASKCW